MPSVPIIPAASTASAIAQGNVAQVRYLLELGHHPNERLSDSRTALILCAFLTDEKWASSLASTLLEKGGRIGLTDRNGLNALHYACLYQCQHLVTLYLKAIDFNLNHVDKFGNTALHYAARSRNLEVVKLLVDKLTKYNLSIDVTNKKGITPLMMAWDVPNEEVAVYLEEAGADIKIRDNYGLTVRYHESQGRQKICDTLRRQKERQLVSKVRFFDLEYPKKKQELLDERRNEETRFRYWKDIEREKTAIPEILPQEEALISPAAPSDARNDPYYLFKTSPVQLFALGKFGQATAILNATSLSNGQTVRPQTALGSIHGFGEHSLTRPTTAVSIVVGASTCSFRSRPKSAMLLNTKTSGKNDVCLGSSLRHSTLHSPSRASKSTINKDSQQHLLSMAQSAGTSNYNFHTLTYPPSWKSQMGLLLDQYTLQCSPSFRPSAKQYQGDTPLIVTQEKEVHGLDNPEGDNRRASQMTRISSGKDSLKKGARRDRNISASSQRSDEVVSIATSSNGPSRSTKKGKQSGKSNSG